MAPRKSSSAADASPAQVRQPVCVEPEWLQQAIRRRAHEEIAEHVTAPVNLKTDRDMDHREGGSPESDVAANVGTHRDTPATGTIARPMRATLAYPDAMLQRNERDFSAPDGRKTRAMSPVEASAMTAFRLTLRIQYAERIRRSLRPTPPQRPVSR